MAFPTIVAINEGVTDLNNTVHLAPLPSGCNVVGRLVIVAVTTDGGNDFHADLDPVTWTFFGGGPAVAMRQEFYYRIIDGTEGYTGDGTDTLRLENSNGEEWASHSFCISGQHATSPPELLGAVDNTGSSNAADPPSKTASWGSDENLWIAVAGFDGETGISGYPTNYDNNQRWLASSVVGGTACSMASATRNLIAATDDPSAFLMTFAQEWRAHTIVIRPAESSNQQSVAGSVSFSGALATVSSAIPKQSVGGALDYSGVQVQQSIAALGRSVSGVVSFAATLATTQPTRVQSIAGVFSAAGALVRKTGLGAGGKRLASSTDFQGATLRNVAAKRLFNSALPFEGRLDGVPPLPPDPSGGRGQGIPRDRLRDPRANQIRRRRLGEGSAGRDRVPPW